jgi:hypothetical protein
MHFKWDSNVARDIASELNRLEQELSDCKIDMDHCATILLEMQGNKTDEAMEKFISLTGKLRRGLSRLEERFSDTGRGISRANEMFENNESLLQGKAEAMGGGRSVESIGGDPSWRGTAPMFYDVSSAGHPSPPIGLDMAAVPLWPTLEGVSRTVIIDQVSLNSNMVMPQWLQGIIDDENAMY